MLKKFLKRNNSEMIFNLAYLFFLFTTLAIDVYLFYIVYLLSIFLSYKLHLSEEIKKVSIAVPIIFYLIKYISALLNNMQVWKHLSLGYFDIFMDMRSTVRQIKCQYLESINENTINVVENKVCPIFDGYGPLFHLIKLNITNINITTNLISFFCYSLILYLAYKIIGYTKYLPIASALIVSPPVNLLLNQMNIDAIIFIVGVFVLYKNNINYYIRLLIFSVLIFLKVHPAGVLLGFFVYFYKKRDKTLMIYSTIPILLYVFFILVNPESVISQQRPTGPHNAFGLLSTGQYLWISFFNRAIGYRVVLIICFFILTIFLLLVFSNKFSTNFKIEGTFFNYGILFWLLLNFLYANYDYRLILLVFFLIYNLPNLNNFIIWFSLIYIYLSPFVVDINESIFNFLGFFKTILFLSTFYFLLSIMKELLSEIKFFR